MKKKVELKKPTKVRQTKPKALTLPKKPTEKRESSGDDMILL